MTREEFSALAKSWGYGYSEEDIAAILSVLDDTNEIFPGVTARDMAFKEFGVSTEEEWLAHYAKNFLVHY